MAEKKDLTLEEATDALQKILDKMDNVDLSLEDNFKYYEEGLALVKLCNEKLDKIEKKIIVLEEGNEA